MGAMEQWRAEAPVGRRVLVVEDEPLIALALEETLAEHGFRVVASAQTVAVALRHVASVQFDVALLDLAIGAESVEPVADRLAAMGLPFVFATGYGRCGPAPGACRASDRRKALPHRGADRRPDRRCAPHRAKRLIQRAACLSRSRSI